MADSCAICQTVLLDGQPRKVCASCKAEYHQECFEENGGCAIYGCSNVPVIEQRQAIEIPVSYWGQEKKPCPSCGKEILAAAVRCRHCGATFGSARPEDAESFRRRSSVQESLPASRQKVVIMLIVSLVPCAAPIGGVWALIWRSRHTEELAAMPALYDAMSRISVWVGLGEGLVMAVLAGIYAIFHHS